jgi:hypothetical protein
MDPDNRKTNKQVNPGICLLIQAGTISVHFKICIFEIAGGLVGSSAATP